MLTGNNNGLGPKNKERRRRYRIIQNSFGRRTKGARGIKMEMEMELESKPATT